MKETLRQIVSFTMALLVLFSTMSFTVGMHYCGEQLVDFSIFEKVDNCVMKSAMSKSSSECVMMEMDCCSDVEFVMEGQDNLKLSFDKLSFDQQLFVISYVYIYINQFEGLDKNILHFKDYWPPPLIRDVQILDQTFLI